MATVTLEFRSVVAASPEAAWRWITSRQGILREMRPWFRMTFPRDFASIATPVHLGKPLFRSRLYVLGVLPFGHSDLTLLELTPGKGFVEQSPMTGMRLWRHERWIEATSAGTAVSDRLTFEPSFFPTIVAWFVRKLFEHRHAMLQAGLSTR